MRAHIISVTDLDGASEVHVRCRLCGESHFLSVPTTQFRAWKQGQLIQNAIPLLDRTQRELLISGTCDPCWKKMFGR